MRLAWRLWLSLSLLRCVRTYWSGTHLRAEVLAGVSEPSLQPSISSILQLRFRHEISEASNFSSNITASVASSRCLEFVVSNHGIFLCVSAVAFCAFFWAVHAHYEDVSPTSVDDSDLAALSEHYSDLAWGASFQEAVGSRRDAIKLLFDCKIISPDDFSDVNVDHDLVDNAIVIGEDMLLERPSAEWARSPDIASETFKQKARQQNMDWLLASMLMTPRPETFGSPLKKETAAQSIVVPPIARFSEVGECTDSDDGTPRDVASATPKRARDIYFLGLPSRFSWVPGNNQGVEAQDTTTPPRPDVPAPTELPLASSEPPQETPAPASARFSAQPSTPRGGSARLPFEASPRKLMDCSPPKPHPELEAGLQAPALTEVVQRPLGHFELRSKTPPGSTIVGNITVVNRHS